jgi:hypothetical protein
MLADLFTLSGIVPLEKRSKVEARKQGLNYGVYLERQDKPKSKSKQRRSNALTAKQQPFNLEFNSAVYKVMNKGRLTKEEKEILKDTEEEYKLKGHFKRIFPNGNY